MGIRSYFASFFILFIQLTFAQSSYKKLVYEGNENFNKRDYERSSQKYIDAIKLKDKDFTAHYNLGNALYKKKMYEEAKAQYQKAQALASNKADKAAALHNLGNAYMETNDSEKAAEIYKQALKQEPYNEATRKNYEIALLKEKEKQNKKQNQGKEGGKDKESQENNSKDSKPSPDKSQQAEDGGNGNQNKGSGDKGNDPNSQKNNNNGSNMPKDLENSIWNRVGNKERETARRILNKDGYSTPRSNEKDW